MYVRMRSVACLAVWTNSRGSSVVFLARKGHSVSMSISHIGGRVAYIPYNTPDSTPPPPSGWGLLDDGQRAKKRKKHREIRLPKDLDETKACYQGTPFSLCVCPLDLETIG